MDMMHPLRDGVQIGCGGSRTCGSWNCVSSTPLGFWEYWVFIEQRNGPGAPEVGTTHLGAPGPPGAPWWVVLSSENPPGAARAHYVPYGPKKISVKFRCIWTPSDIDFL